MKKEDAQKACKAVEGKMREFLMDFEPARKLQISDAKAIARFARAYMFEAINPFIDD